MARRTRLSASKSVRGGLREADKVQSPNPTEIYNELLAEAAASSPGQESDRPLKRRKLWKPGPPEVASSPASSYSASEKVSEKQGGIQTAFSETEQSEEDDFEWEDVALQQGTAAPARGDKTGPMSEGITLNLEEDKPSNAKSKKKASGPKLDKASRVQAHKAHLLGLLMHAYIRNAWCNDRQVQDTVKRFVPSKVRSSLSPDSGASQYNKDRFFREGLNDLKDIWKLNFKPIKQGIKRPSWPSYLQPKSFRLPPETERLMDVKDFRKAAKTLEGSQDTGVQLLCAVLRSLGVETRLVCSLQPLSIGVSQKDFLPDIDITPDKTEKVQGKIGDSDAETSKAIQGEEQASEPPLRKRRLGQPNLGAGFSQPPSEVEQTHVYRTRYPVYWVEAFNAAVQKWTPIEPFSTDTVGKPAKLEPPLNQSSSGIRMVYVVAFEEDGVAKDVTKRYASAYNAKTRRERIESTEGGEKWLKKAMRIFRRRGAVLTDREQIEAAELAKKEAQEGMPRAIQDFKDHPVYALERHLKRNEVIHPKREVGKVGATGKSEKLEPVYRRGDIKVVRSADKWYRLGREIVAGEQPLKHLIPKRTSRGIEVTNEIDDAADEDSLGTPLYAPFQTQVYIPPPCVHGRVPKNGFGNIDVYVPSMIPPGGEHIRHAEASRAAQLIGVDYADAVIGFEFKGRRGTAITQGIVVAQEYAVAIEAVLKSIEYAKEQSEEHARSMLALRTWKRFMVGLRVLQRVNEYEIEGERGTLPSIDGVFGGTSDDDNEQTDLGGGFFPDNEQDEAVPTGRPTRRRVIEESEVEEDTSDDSTHQGNTRIKKQEDLATDDAELLNFSNKSDEGGGGFLVEDDGNGGGFFPEETFDSEPTNHGLKDQEPNVLSDIDDLRTPFGGGGSITNSERSNAHPPESHLKAVQLPLHRQDQSSGFHLDGNDIPDKSCGDSPTDNFEIQLALANGTEPHIEGGRAIANSVTRSSEIESDHNSPDQSNVYGSDVQKSSEPEMDGMRSGSVDKISSSAVKEIDSESHVEEPSDSSDRGSLLSHDPEDEEADPDWLAEI